MRLLKRWRWPCSSRRRSLTRGTRSSTVPVPKVSLRPWDRPLCTTGARPVSCRAMTLDVVVGFRLQRRHQHPPRSEPCDLIQLKKLLACFPSSSTLYYLQHQWRLLPPLPPGFALPTRKATPPF